jgi:hypothetical protein
MPEAMPDFNAMVRVYERLAEPLTGCRLALNCKNAGVLVGSGT